MVVSHVFLLNISGINVDIDLTSLGRTHLPEKFGARFSRKCATPSVKSSLWMPGTFSSFVAWMASPSVFEKRRFPQLSLITRKSNAAENFLRQFGGQRAGLNHSARSGSTTRWTRPIASACRPDLARGQNSMSSIAHGHAHNAGGRIQLIPCSGNQTAHQRTQV